MCASGSKCVCLATCYTYYPVFRGKKSSNKLRADRLATLTLNLKLKRESLVYQKLCWDRRIARRAKLVEILCTTAGTSCTTNPEQIEVIKIEGYSGPTCSKQPGRVGVAGVVNKLGVDDLC